MKNNIFFLLAILFILSSCQSKFDNPLVEVSKTLAEPNQAKSGFLNLRLFTIDKDFSSSSSKQLMKMSIDYDTRFDKLGFFIFTDDHLSKQKKIKELASIDLSNDKNADSKYVGKMILSLTEKNISHHVDSMLYKLYYHGSNGKPSTQIISSFKLGQPNSYPFGIQDYQRDYIKEDEMMRLYSFELRKGNNFESTGYHGKLVSVFYDSTKKDELLYQLDWNLNQILSNHSDKLTLPNQLVEHGDYDGQESDFQGFAFGENGE